MCVHAMLLLLQIVLNKGHLSGTTDIITHFSSSSSTTSGSGSSSSGDSSRDKSGTENETKVVLEEQQSHITIFIHSVHWAFIL